jgi:hypothetical protein
MPQFTVRTYERGPEEPPDAVPQCSAAVPEHTPEEHRLEEDSPEKSGKPEPLLPLSED